MRFKSHIYLRWATFNTCLIALLCLASLNGCEIKIGGKGDKKKGEKSAVPVSILAVSVGNIANNLRLNAIVEPEKDVEIYSKTAGLVIQLMVEEGDYVRKGQLLLKLDDKLQSLAIKRAQASAERQHKALERAEKLFTKAMLTEEEVEGQRLAVMDADINVKQAELALEYTSIVAPFAGIIAIRSVDEGDQIAPGRAMFRLFDQSHLLINCWVSPDELRHLKNGIVAQVHSQSFPEEKITARILRISPIVDSQYGKVKVTFQVEDSKHLLKPGEFVELSTVTEYRDSVLVIPKKAVLYEAGLPTAFVANDTLSIHRRLKLGLETSDYAEVITGLNLGDLIIVEGQGTLKDSTLIRIVRNNSH